MSKKNPLDDETCMPLAEWASLQTSLVWAHQGPVAEQWRKGRIFSPHLAAWLIRRGRVTVRLGGRSWSAREGQWMFPPEGDREQNFTEDAELISIRFKASWPTGESLFSEGLGIVVPESEAPELTRAAEDMVGFITRNLPQYISWDVMQCTATLAQSLEMQTLSARWLELIVKVLSARGVTPSRIGRMDARVLKIVRHLERRAWGDTVKESDLADQVGLSVSQLNRLFVRQFGVSTHGYFDRKRYESALAALTESAHSIKEISYRLGFSSLQHFSTWFNRRHGSPPRILRAQAEEARRSDTELKLAPEAPSPAKTTRAPRPASAPRRRRTSA